VILRDESVTSRRNTDQSRSFDKLDVVEGREKIRGGADGDELLRCAQLVRAAWPSTQPV
jgi:hypothetical protein